MDGCLSITADRQTDMADTTQRSSWWSVTINNPQQSDIDEMNAARQAGWHLEGQLEKGAEGTPHYQLAVKTPVQVRFSAVKKMFSRGHIEVARKPSALVQYVAKEDTRVAPLPVQSEMYPSLTKFWSLVIKEIDDWNIYIIPKWKGEDEGPNSWFEWSDRKHGGPCPTPDQGFHYAVNNLIEKGYHVESIAVNPQVISAWRRYHKAICTRVYNERDQERRALEEAAVVSVPITNANEEDNSPAAPPPPPPPPPPPSGRQEG